MLTGLILAYRTGQQPQPEADGILGLQETEDAEDVDEDLPNSRSSMASDTTHFGRDHRPFARAFRTAEKQRPLNNVHQLKKFLWSNQRSLGRKTQTEEH